MNTRNLLRWSSVILVGVYLVPLVLYYCKFADGRWELSKRQDVWGQFGDFIGGMVNPVFSLAGTLGLLYTILLTREEVAYTRKQWALARKEAREAEELRESAKEDEARRLRRETTFMMYKIWISGDMQQIRTDVWAATQEEVRNNSARPVSIEYWRGNGKLERHYYSWGTISHFVGDLSRLLQSGSLDPSLFSQLFSKSLGQWYKLQREVTFGHDSANESGEDKEFHEFHVIVWTPQLLALIECVDN